MDVLANDVNLVADALERDDPLLVAVERPAGLIHAAARQRDRAQVRSIQLKGLDFGVDVFVLLVELEQAFVGLGARDDFVEVIELGVAGRGTERG